jgi:hypothetical protein
MVMAFPFGDNFPPYDILSGGSQDGVLHAALDPTKSSVSAVQKPECFWSKSQFKYPARRISADKKTKFAFLRCAASTRVALVLDKHRSATA